MTLANTLPLLSRLVAYPLGLFLTMWLASFFGDTYGANLALFTLYVATLEFLVLTPQSCWKRAGLYAGVVLGVVLSGAFLIHFVAVCHAQ